MPATSTWRGQCEAPRGETLPIVLQAVGATPLIWASETFAYPAGEGFLQQPGSGGFDNSWFGFGATNQHALAFQTFVTVPVPGTCDVGRGKGQG
jgi:hypothetical protein